MPGSPGHFVLEAMLLHNHQRQSTATITPLGGVVIPHSVSIFEFTGLNTQQLAERLNLPKSWVESHSGTQALDPIPHFSLGRHACFGWGSHELASWIQAHSVTANRDADVLDRQLIFKFIWYDSLQLAERWSVGESSSERVCPHARL